MVRQCGTGQKSAEEHIGWSKSEKVSLLGRFVRNGNTAKVPFGTTYLLDLEGKLTVCGHLISVVTLTVVVVTRIRIEERVVSHQVLGPFGKTVIRRR